MIGSYALVYLGAWVGHLGSLRKCSKELIRLLDLHMPKLSNFLRIHMSIEHCAMLL